MVGGIFEPVGISLSIEKDKKPGFSKSKKRRVNRKKISD